MMSSEYLNKNIDKSLRNNSTEVTFFERIVERDTSNPNLKMMKS